MHLPKTLTHTRLLTFNPICVIILIKLVNNSTKMKLSIKSDYGLRALIDLAERYGQGPVQSAEIASRQFIPPAYLDQLLSQLRKTGFLRSLRGPQGGHYLARPPREITVAEVVTALEGSLLLMPCLETDQNCPDTAGCVLQPLWRQTGEAMAQILAGVTLDDLVQQKQQASRREMYYI